MAEKLFETLEVCIKALESGADIEAVLMLNPQMADELRPILKASIRVQSLAAPSIPKGAMRRGRTRLLQHAAEMRESTSKPRRARFSLFRLTTSLALALIFVLGSTGLVRASSGALPGDNLYTVKRTWEDVRLLLVFDDEGRVALENEFEDERLEEISELLIERRYETIIFIGMVIDQNKAQWLVSGIKVFINDDSQLPVEPVTVGASIMVEGSTNLQGFVDADRVELLEPGINPPPFEPAEIKDLEEAEGNEYLGTEKSEDDDGDGEDGEDEGKNSEDDSKDGEDDSEDNEDDGEDNEDDGEDNEDDGEDDEPDQTDKPDDN